MKAYSTNGAITATSRTRTNNPSTIYPRKISTISLVPDVVSR